MELICLSLGKNTSRDVSLLWLTCKVPPHMKVIERILRVRLRCVKQFFKPSHTDSHIYIVGLVPALTP
jgi:hypothetical protein